MVELKDKIQLYTFCSVVYSYCATIYVQTTVPTRSA